MRALLLAALLLGLLSSCGGECGAAVDSCKGGTVSWSSCTSFTGSSTWYRLHTADGKDRDFPCAGPTVPQMDACAGALIDAFDAACR